MVNAKVLVAGLAGLASAAPNVAKRNDRKQVTHNFEDAPILPLVTVTESGVYHKEIDYTGFFYIQTGLDGLVLAGVETESPPNCLSSNILPTLLGGTPTATAYGDVKSFDFDSFYFGCVVNTLALGLLSVNQGCKVTVTGYDDKGNGVANQQFDFVPTGLNVNMTKAVLNDDFKYLNKIQFETASALSDVLVADLLDNLSYTLHY